MVSYSEETALANAQNWHELDRATRDKLYRRFGRAALPPSAATEWAAARSDRSGRRQIAFLKLYLKDPTFGSLTVKEAQKVEDSSSNSTLWRWESEDDLLVRYAFLPREERVEKVKEEMASATKKQKHPAKKGEFIYRFWRGTTESDSSASSKNAHSASKCRAWLSNGSEHRIRPRLRSVGCRTGFVRVFEVSGSGPRSEADVQEDSANFVVSAMSTDMSGRGRPSASAVESSP